MSSPTETTLGIHQPKLRRAQRRANLSGLIGGLAIVLALGLLSVFVWQAGVLAPTTPKEATAIDVVAQPEQITSENASIAGRDKNNLPFEIRAASGQQDKTIDSLVLMQKVISVFERPSGSKLDVTSDNGRYDRKTKALELSGNVVFKEGVRFKAEMQAAAIDTIEQTLASKSPVKVDMQGTMIEAESLTVTENGTRILFRGGVKAHFEMKKNTTGDGQ
jgi:lipopolysaccharide export system protein LptC